MDVVGNVHRGPLTVREFEWRIPGFTLLSGENGECYCSPPFVFAEESWYLRIYPNGCKDYNSVGYIGAYLTRHFSGRPINLQFSICFKTTDGKKRQETPLTYVFKEAEEGYGAPWMIWRSWFLKRKSELTPSGTLTVLCTMTYSKFTDDESNAAISECCHCKGTLDAESISTHERKCPDRPMKCPECSEVVVLKKWYDHECQVPKMGECSHCKETVDAESISSHEKKCLNKPIKCPECSYVIALKHWYDHNCQGTDSGAEGEMYTLESSPYLHTSKVLHDFKKLFLSKDDCDVVIKVKGKEFPAHKAILKVRSPVFASTFRCDMKEKTTGIINIEDCDPSSFSDFLCFLYCGTVDNLSGENVFSLFSAADKYDVQDLRAKCLEFMRANISVDTFCDTIKLALQHSETDLVNLATDFFTENALKIVVTMKWQLFLADNPTQGNELLIELLAPNKGSDI